MSATGPTRVVVVGAGFAGFTALRRLERTVGARPDVELALVTPQDYMLYTPLLPEVAFGVLPPRNVAVSLRQALPRTSVVPGWATSVDVAGRTVTVDPGDPDGHVVHERWDRLVLVPGSVSRQVDIPGVAEVAHGVKTLNEALFLRDHLLAQLDRADALPDTVEGRAERDERLTVVAVGAGYTSTELVGQLQRWLHTVAPGGNASGRPTSGGSCWTSAARSSPSSARAWVPPPPRCCADAGWTSVSARP